MFTSNVYVLRDAELVELKGFYDKGLIQLNDYMKFVASFYHYDLSACNETFSNSENIQNFGVHNFKVFKLQLAQYRRLLVTCCVPLEYSSFNDASILILHTKSHWVTVTNITFDSLLYDPCSWFFL